MTHGVESGPETSQDSTALTYLEGLLMHPVTTGPAATATRRSEPDRNNGENANQVTRVFQLPNHGSPSRDKGSPPVAASQHLKKARLLRSGAWSEADSQKQSGPVAEVNGQKREQYKGSLDSSGQGESTLLASLLQSFSSRLESVALSQHISQSHKHLNAEHCESAPFDKETYQSYGTASGRLKSLLRKSKQQNHNTVPYCRQSNQNPSSDSPHSSQSSAQPTGPEFKPCTERLKAVANMVRTRLSPAPSPKPSVACSQLALLLSSEAHLQQYSREQALKAQLTSRSASERLAAMATQQTQDTKSPSTGQTPTAPDMLSSLNVQNGTFPPPTLNSNNRNPSLSSPSMKPPKERRAFDKHGRPPQNCSSLLLLLLKNHNSQQQLTKNGHLEEDCSILLSRASSVQSDSEYSNQEYSLTKDSSDAESFYSSSPIDLSMKSRAPSQKSEPCFSLTSSLDKLTDSLINQWKPEPSVPKVYEATDLDCSPDMKSHDKVTLMQLLLDRRNNKNVNKSSDNPGLRPDTVISSLTAAPHKWVGTPEDSRTPLDWQTGGGLSTFSSVSTSYSYPSPCAQSSPLDLCKSNVHSSEKKVEPSFCASKLLQNMAQSGMKNLSPSPPPLHSHKPSSRRQSPKFEHDKPQALLDHPVIPVKRNRTSTLDGPPAVLTPHICEQSPSASTQIENLLEKRTVLQLLLGTASYKDRINGHRVSEVAAGGVEKPWGVSANGDSSNGPSVDLKIKTEPVEENLSSDNSDDGVYSQRRLQQHTPIVKAQDKVRSELSPTETAAKFGLLSELLKQQNATYHSNSHKPKLFMNKVKEEPLDCHSHVPKKRKLCIELAEHLSNELCQRSGDTTTDSLVSETPEHNGKGLIRPKEEDLFGSPRSKAHLSRESQGFNVLKQLLLSENSLKELSQPRGTLSPFHPQANCAANGNITQSGLPHELSNLPWYPYSPSLGPGVLKTAPASVPFDSTGGSQPWAKVSPNACSKLVKKDPESSPEETFSREERSGPDSPPLTRSNPILYYMLQRGSGQLSTEIRDQVQPAHCVKTVKVEPCSDYEHSRSSPAHQQTHSQREESLNGSVEKW